MIRRALAHAGIAPRQLGYVEAHGTGTPLGDPIELNALADVMTRAPDTTPAASCAVGSVKTNIGHLEAAAGVAGLIKTVLSLKHEAIPPHLHYRTPNPHGGIEGTGLTIPTRLHPWQRAAGLRRHAGISSFGFGGSLAHVVLAEAPPLPASGASWPWQLLTFSAKTPTALDHMAGALADALRTDPSLPLADAAYTHQVARDAFGHRRMRVCQSRDEAIDALARPDPDRVGMPAKGPVPDIVFMFPGQGAQRVGMAEELYRHVPAFRALMDDCAERLRPHLGHDLREILHPAEGEAGRAASALVETDVAQPALFAVEYALARLWMQWGIKPAALIGHSVGEYVAACLAGVFSLDDALSLVAARGRLMQALPRGAMLSVALPEDRARAFTSGEVALAAVNSPERCVLSGTPGAILELEHHLHEAGVSCRRLRTSHAFHSPMMEPMLASFARLVAEVPRQSPTIPFISNLTGTWIEGTQATDPAYWTSHLREAVRYSDGLATLSKGKAHVLLEVGPGHALTLLARQHAGRAGSAAHVLPTLSHDASEASDLAAMLDTLGRLWVNGHAVDWHAFHRDQPRRRVALPAHPFERARHWLEPVVRPLAEPRATPDAMPAEELSLVPRWEAWTPAMEPLSRVGQRTATTLILADDLALRHALSSHHPGAMPIDPGAAQAIEHALAAHPSWDHLVWAVPAGDPLDEPASAPAVFGFKLIKALLASGHGDRALTLSVLTRQAWSIPADEPARPAHAAVHGLMGSLAKEYPHWSVRVLDLPAATEDWPPSRLADIAPPASGTALAYRRGQWWRQQLFRVRPVGETHAREVAPWLRQGGVCVIVGGAGGLGEVCSEHLIRKCQAQVVWIGRRPPSADIDAKCARLAQRGPAPCYVSADARDLDALRQAKAIIQSRFGTVHAVVHAPPRAAGPEPREHGPGDFRRVPGRQGGHRRPYGAGVLR